FLYPAMSVGKHEVYWHRPLVAYLSAATGQPTVLPDAPAGYLTAAPRPGDHVELWPRFLRRDAHPAAVELFAHAHDPRPHVTTVNISKILDTTHLLGKRLPCSLARRLLDVPKHQTLEEWLDALPGRSEEAERCQRLVGELRRCIEAEPVAL